MTPDDIPLLNGAPNLRHRVRSDGSLRVWWEPSATQRKAGAIVVDLSDLRPGEALRRARQLSKGLQVDRSPRDRSIDAMIKEYQGSRFYKDLRNTTQASYRVDLRAISDKWGSEPAVAITAPMMDAWYEALLRSKGTHRALALLTMMRILMRYGETRGWIPRGSNPATKLKMTKPAGRERVASDAERAAIWAAAPQVRDISLPLALALVTGQRQTDILKAQVADFKVQVLHPPGHAAPVRGYVWLLRQSKRGRALPVPIIDPVAVALLDAVLQRRSGALVINSYTGKPFDRFNFANRWEDLRAIAAKTTPSVASLQWRDLRRTVSVGLRSAGLDRDDTGDLLGNTIGSNNALAAIYTPATLSTTLRAVGAITPLPERKKA
jgi:integrase